MNNLNFFIQCLYIKKLWYLDLYLKVDIILIEVILYKYISSKIGMFI